MTIEYNNLVLEVTRRCNMHCEHCLRGDAQDCDMPLEIINKALENVTSINELTFTGGEPTLNLPAMQHTLNVCRKNNITISGFFIATNGKIVTDEFLKFLIDLYTYVMQCNGGYDEHECVVALSKDEFHDDIPVENEYKLKSLRMYSDMKQRNWANDKINLIDRGRAKQLLDWDTMEHPYINDPGIEETDDGFRVEETLLVSATGDFIPDCDYEFDETENCSIGNLNDTDTLHILADYRGIDLDPIEHCT